MAHDQKFFLALAAKGKDAWNEWRHTPANKDVRVTFARNNFSESPWDEIDFSGFEFGDHADFSGCKWRGGELQEIEEHEAFAPGRAWFAGAAFGHEAKFTGASFGNQANFTCATFRHGTNFAGAVFGYAPTFPGAEFGHRASFAAVIFIHRAKFTGATFADEANFTSANFGDKASFAVRLSVRMPPSRVRASVTGPPSSAQHSVKGPISLARRSVRWPSSTKPISKVALILSESAPMRESLAPGLATNLVAF